jgi:hypothetical protein
MRAQRGRGFGGAPIKKDRDWRGKTYRLLPTELITREAEDDKLIGVRLGDLFVEVLETLVLGCEAAFRGCVYDEEDFAFVGFEGDGVSFLCSLPKKPRLANW